MKIQMPTSPDAEQNLLGSIMIDPQLITDYDLDRIPDEAFYSEKNRVVWQHIKQLYWDGLPIDSPAIMESLRKAKQLEAAGTASYIIGLMTEVTGIGTNTYHYRDVLLETYKQRQLISACGSGIQKTVDDGYEPARDELIKRVHEIDADHHYSLEQAADQAETFIEGIEGARLPTGFRGVDTMLGGLPVGDLTVLAARTSMGKSALCHNIAFRVGNTHVLTPDQPLPEIMISEACRRSKVSYASIRKKYVTDENKDLWRKHFQKVKEEMQTLCTFDDRQLTFERMISEVRRAARSGRKLVIVDHVQHVRSHKHKDKRMLMVDITGTLKSIAREEGISILALSQLTRDIDFRQDKRPTLIDLSESKTLEEDANAVLFLYRDGYYNPGSTQANLAEIIVGKSKTSPRLDMTQLIWDGNYMEFRDISQAA